jgi:RNA polymerase sigma-70 factor (ECF subfamily)
LVSFWLTWATNLSAQIINSQLIRYLEQLKNNNFAYKEFFQPTLKLYFMSQSNNLVKKLKKGDIQAFNKLFEAYSPRLYAFGLKYLKYPADAEELVQDVFLKIWRSRKRLDEERSFQAYIFTITYNQIKDYFKYKAVFMDIEDEELPDKADYSTEETIAYYSVYEKIIALLDQLPEKKKRIFHLSRFEGKSAKEIAAIIGVSPKTVDNQVSEVIGYLRKSLRDAGFLQWLFFYLFLM